ncbi:aldo/keto reductase [Pedobacter frigidisoli]|uniref:aldo/keto reductase n=1 Tax=Pedobacter frigidisoli TaxID=2530455 RepID=UPI0029304BC9|nr:aldo/keto reductase [Pedobacter frigidisoli]
MDSRKNVLPRVVFGTSSLGNLYKALPYMVKKEIIKEIIDCSSDGILFDTAGKYGAGLALEVLGKCLEELGVNEAEIAISNKLGWYRVPLTGKEPTFEKGVWAEIDYDAVQRISYRGILECFHQGNELLGKYQANMVSVHDPDEYLAASTSEADRIKRLDDIFEAYRALKELRDEGKVDSIGIGAKDWKIIEEISSRVSLDWIMIANSLTIKTHPIELIEFINSVSSKGVRVINSAVFNGGFLIGGDFYNYQLVSKGSAYGRKLFEWRDSFFNLCKKYEISPAEACCAFALHFPGISSIALSSSRPEKVAQNIKLAQSRVSAQFWEEMVEEGLIQNY